MLKNSKWDLKVDINIANVMKMPTATKDLGFNLARPITPCPLVQPFYSLDPRPTSNPAKINPIMLKSAPASA